MEAKESARLLKAHDIRGLGSKVAFNFEDIRGRCDAYVEQVRQQTRSMLESAAAEADEIRRKAHQEGLMAGRREGMNQADAQISQVATRSADEKLRTALPALQQAAYMLRQERDRWLAAWDQAAVRLSTAVAEKLIRSELSNRPELAKGMLAAALELAVGSPQIRVRLNPVDHTSLGVGAEDVVRALAGCGQATLVVDETVTQGGCVIDTDHGQIDARIETQLERIVAELVAIES
ncbi:MAG: FliH/SctL family protein [Planctomycetaceae bacterium]